MGFQAPLSFLNAYDFRRGMLKAIDEARDDARLFVLEASSIVEIDFTAAAILVEVIDRAQAAGLIFAVARLESVPGAGGLRPPRSHRAAGVRADVPERGGRDPRPLRQGRRRRLTAITCQRWGSWPPAWDRP